MNVMTVHSLLADAETAAQIAANATGVPWRTWESRPGKSGGVTHSRAFYATRDPFRFPEVCRCRELRCFYPVGTSQSRLRAIYAKRKDEVVDVGVDRRGET